MRSQCTYRCVVLPDALAWLINGAVVMSQCTYRCVVLPDTGAMVIIAMIAICLNAPTGAWCSLTQRGPKAGSQRGVSMHLQVRGAP